MTGFCLDSRLVEHDTGPHHPERPDRLRTIARAVRLSGLIDSPDPFPDFQMDLGLKPIASDKLVEIAAARAEEKWLLGCHSPRYIEQVRHLCDLGGGVLDQSDTPVCPESYELAMLGLGGVLSCCDAVMTGRVRRAFAAVRPPGHHAEPDRGMGFCLFSNVAIAARYLQRQYGIERVAIVDFDVHHGNGTQACTEDDPSLFFISLHQDPRTLYPGTGYAWEIGTGRGRGYTLNIPMEPGSGDEPYCRIIDTRVVPELEEFDPQVLLLSAGFDAHRLDPLAQMQVSEDGFELMTRSLCALAERHCGGRVISVLEGGYNLLALGRSVVRHLLAMG